MEHVPGPIGLFLILFMVFVIAIPYAMAIRRNRSGIGWVLISVVISPILAIIALLVLGDARR